MPRPKKKPGEVRASMGAAVLPEIDAEIEAISVIEDRSKSSVIEKLLLRGLAAYNRDGKLIEEAVAVPASNAELLAEFGRLPIVYAEELTPADADARPVASAKPKHG